MAWLLLIVVSLNSNGDFGDGNKKSSKEQQPVHAVGADATKSSIATLIAVRNDIFVVLTDGSMENSVMDAMRHELCMLSVIFRQLPS